MTGSTYPLLAGTTAIVVTSLILTFSLDGFDLYRFTLAAIYAIAVIGINLLTGLSGQFSIGHGAFFAIGAYVAAIAMRDGGINAYAAIGLAGIAGFVAGYLFGWPALRLSLVHLTLATWALAVAVPQLLKSPLLEEWTGGVQGIYFTRPATPAWSGLNDDQWWHLVVTAILLVLIAAAWNLSHGRSARALKAIRDNELAAAPMGIAVAHYKTAIFGISAAHAAIAGALGGLLNDFVAPDAYGVWFSILLLIGAIAGGLGSVWGALIGGLLIQFLPDLARTASGALSFPAYGLILLAIVYLMPSGFMGLFERRSRRRP